MTNIYSEAKEAFRLLGFTDTGTNTYELNVSNDAHDIRAVAEVTDDAITTGFWVDGKSLPSYAQPRVTSNIAAAIRNTERILSRYGHSPFISLSDDIAVTAAINTKDISSDIIRCKSSNVWGYKFNVRKQGDRIGDLIMQFKGNQGGPGDIYIYYDVPVDVYRRMQSSPSTGHFFWVYIRNNFKYSKLTGNKRGVLRNAVNH